MSASNVAPVAEPKFATDRWISPKLSEFMYKHLRQDVRHIETRFGQNVADTVWLEWAARENRAAITGDLSIARSVGELEDVKRLRSIVFLMDINHLSRWDRVEVLVRSWKRMKELVQKTESGPVVYLVGARGLFNSDPEKNRIQI